MRTRWLAVMFLLAGAGGAQAYVRFTTGPIQTQGSPLVRTDFTNIQFLVSSTVAAGATNSAGQTTIAPGSDVFGAIQAAMNAWNGVQTSRARFAAPQPTSLSNNPSDGKCVITIQDTPENRSVIGDLLGVTLLQFTSTGNIVDSDILLDPGLVFNGTQIPYSTNHALNTIDLESVITHELGHSLGANHSGLLSATMFQSGVPFEEGATAEATLWSTLSPDDIAFATSAYPTPGANSSFGGISGNVVFTNGAPVRGALVAAIDASSGIAAGTISNITDGTFTIAMIPPGNYQVYAQPMDGPVSPANLYFSSGAPLDTSFQTSFFGGVDQPGTVQVAAGSSAAAAITVDTAAATLNPQFIAAIQGSGAMQVVGSARVIPGGQATDVLVYGPGLDPSDTVQILGPATIRAGTLRLDPSNTAGGFIPLRFTVDTSPVTARASASIVVTDGTDAAALSGGLVIVAAPAASPSIFTNGVVSASGFGGFSAIAPGSWIEIYGANLSATTRPWIGSDFNGPIAPTSLDGVTVTVGGKQAYLDYISPGQVNALVPSDAPTGSVQVTVSNSVGTSDPYSINVNATEPGLLAPSSFQIAGMQYAAAMYSDGQTFVLPAGTISGVPSRQAKPGDTIVLYGIGFGSVSPSMPAGTIVSQSNSLTLPLRILFGNAPATLAYDGLAPNFTGLYQFNVVVPDVPDSELVPLTFSLAGIAGRQTLYLAVHH
jgi:uncharacterized protein (TIGR03437 family)